MDLRDVLKLRTWRGLMNILMFLCYQLKVATHALYMFQSVTVHPIYFKGSLNSCCIVTGNRRACNEGYKLHPNGLICVPVCEKDCINGYCYLPDFCQCLDGYAKELVNCNVCLPTCPNGCSNGHCFAPGKCVCLPGSILLFLVSLTI
jgi:hypothetical protein